ncbi:hypothetical protein Hamer_G026097 [Homarus americanus]|uniref:Uncharacterized protein n=1 Tax=Homarus americanus TaxID=6706 RepID=A0A8J5NDX5_HOMAM|nr:hypothetical protein Hamer_G026097 [Homarus americanus]
MSLLKEPPPGVTVDVDQAHTKLTESDLQITATTSKPAVPTPRRPSGGIMVSDPTHQPNPDPTPPNLTHPTHPPT